MMHELAGTYGFIQVKVSHSQECAVENTDLFVYLSYLLPVAAAGLFYHFYTLSLA